MKLTNKISEKSRRARLYTCRDLVELGVLLFLILLGLTVIHKITSPSPKNNLTSMTWWRTTVFNWVGMKSATDNENHEEQSEFVFWNVAGRVHTNMDDFHENYAVADSVLEYENGYHFEEIDVGYKGKMDELKHRADLETVDLRRKGVEVLEAETIARPNTKKQCDVMPDSHRFDCHPEVFPTEVVCSYRGCCWSNSGGEIRAAQNGSSEFDARPPSCFYPINYDGYRVAAKPTRSTSGISVSLKRTTNSYYPDTIKNLLMDISYETPYRLRIKITDQSEARWQVPLSRPSFTRRAKTSDNMYTVDVPDQGQTFALTVNRQDTGTPIINTTGGFLYNDQFLQLSYFLPSNYIYGLGEHRDTLLHSVNWTKFVMWNHDQPPEENANLYGSHPFYLMMENDTNSHGVFLLNSNAMEVILQPAPAITWRTIGGILDFYVFLGPTPSDVISQYTEMIGRTFMPPYWSLGFHQSRWGYTTAKATQDIADKLTEAGMPQDAQWNDLDYMDKRKDFTTAEKFGNQKQLADTLHSQGKHYIIIVDPGISNTQTRYAPFDLGKSLGIFINNTDGTPVVGIVWPGTVVFPDFTNPAIAYYWSTVVKSFHDQVAFDGLWIDMNEISNFVSGSVTGCHLNDRYEHPPYVPGVKGGKLRSRTTCVSGKQYLSITYNVHNLYSLGESKASYIALSTARPGKRPFVISRSTFPGQGQFGGHWSGDNAATFYDMYKSISEILSFNMFGIPMVGADICGFRRATTEELCQRWYQLGAFYPFSRSHNDILMPDQDPTAFSSALLNSTRDVYLTRYSLLPYLYTLFYKSHVTGDTVARPVFVEFPYDKWTYNVDKQFLLGPALMVSPVLHENTTWIYAYFPQTTWFYFPPGGRMTDSGGTFGLPAPLNRINLHIRGGYILPMQEPALTTTHSRKNKFWLLVALMRTLEAKGDLYWDDGDSDGSYEEGSYNTFQFTAQNNTVTSELVHVGYTAEAMILGNVTVLGVLSEPKTVTINGDTTPFDYNQRHEVLYVTNFKADMLKPFKMAWS